MSTHKSKRNQIVTLVLMMLSLNTIYQLPYLMYYYYTPLQDAMGLIGRDADYGRLLNVYGIANVILYLPGGWIADKYDSKKLLVVSMIGTGLLGLWESMFPSYTMLMVIFVLYAVTTVLTYWSASIKIINVVAGSDEQGSMFGTLEAGRGVVGLLITTAAVAVFTSLAANSKLAMTVLIAGISVIMIIVGVLMALFLPKAKVENATNASIADTFKAMGHAFKHPSTYLLAGMIFCGSLTLASASYYAPYLEQVCGMSSTVTSVFANYRSVFSGLIGASAATVLAVKMKRSSAPMIGAGIMLIACFVLLLLIPGSAAVMWPLLIIMVLASLGTSVYRALYYATIDESGVPKNMVGSLIGIASILGFLPDTFYTSMAGGWLDKYGVGGFKYIFMACIASSALGLVCSFISDRQIKKYRKDHPVESEN